MTTPAYVVRRASRAVKYAVAAPRYADGLVRVTEHAFFLSWSPSDVEFPKGELVRYLMSVGFRRHNGDVVASPEVAEALVEVGDLAAALVEIDAEEER